MNEVLEQLAELYAKRDLLTIDKSKAMPDEIKHSFCARASP